MATKGVYCLTTKNQADKKLKLFNALVCITGFEYIKKYKMCHVK